MKPVLKKDKASCSVSEESSSQRPKRSAYLKTLDGSNGLLWREENDLKRALYASLQETRKRNLDEEETAEDEEEEAEADVKEAAAEVKKEAAVSEDGEDEILKKAKVHAQRKFAQGTNPNSPVPTPQKVPPVNNSTKELLPYKRPKTEDFLTFLCLRGTSILPPSLDFLNCCSKSDTSSDCRSLSPDPEAKDLGSHKESVSKGSEPREKNSARHENLSNGVSRKLAVCKASLKKHVLSSQTAKKTGSKSQKEINIVRKRKSRDESEDEFLPTNSSLRTKTHVNARTRSSTFHALREKYKKQRIAADKKKVPSSGNAEVKGLTTRSQSIPKKTSKTVSRQAISSKRQRRSLSPVHNKKATGPQQKLAIEKRKSLRSADPPKGPAHRKDSNKKRLLRRAKLVPPIVDVESESEPEVINLSPTRKTSLKQDKASRLSGRLKDKQDANKSNEGLTSRQILLRKHMQNRLAAKKSALHAKNLKSKTIVKKTAKQVISKKVFKKNLVSTTMSLRKDLQNKRVTRSAKHQIEEMLWSHPEKKAKSSIAKGLPASRTDKKRISSDEQLLPKKSKLIVSKLVENKQGKSASDKEVKTRTVDSKGTKPTASSKVLKKTDALMNTRSTKTVSSNEPKPGCSHDVDDVLQPKINNTNKSSISVSKKAAHISDVSRHIVNNTNSLDVESQKKSNKIKLYEEQKSSKLPCKVDLICNIKPHDDKERNFVKKDNNLENNKHSLLVTDEANVQNNLNLHKNDKIISKDISKLINLNVECDESVLVLNSEPSCSGTSQNDINKKLNQESPLSLNSEPLPSLSFIKKHYDPKYIKNISYKTEKLKKVLDKNRKEPNKFSEKSSKSHKKDPVLKSPDKNKAKTDLKKQQKESILSSDSDSNTEIMESVLLVGSNSKGKNKSDLPSKEKSEIKKNRLEKLDSGKRSVKVDHKKESKKTKLEFSKDVNLKSDSKVKNDSKKHSVSSENTSSMFDQDTDDDSDIDITLGEYLEKKSKESVGENSSTTSPTKEINTDIKSVPSTSKDSKTSKKESEKESQKSKKEGESYKHKKDKISSKDKMSRKDSEKSLAKLLKRELSKSLRKEEKLKYKRDGSSSSKSSKDKDGSKLNKKDGEKESSSDRKDSKGEFSDIKKDKSSKKESKLSRSNSYDDTKSPKKKKKLTDEFKQIEEIKNFISNSSILNEISEFKRRLSGDKSEFKKRLSKSKKRKKLALLKEKKLSKKLSSKLLRKYSKKKGLKKKNKLKKKELRKEGKSGASSTKSKNKSKKHKTKGEHKKDSQDKIKNSDKTPSCSTSTETACPSSILPELLPTVTQKVLNIPQPIPSNIQTSTGDIAIPLTLSSEAISKVNYSPSLSVTRRESLDQVFTATNSCTSTSTNTSISESAFPSEAFVQAKRNSISQVPLHFAPKASNHPKTMTDAATNTCDDDIDETLSPIPELLKNVEMSVGTQTITPVGSPSPTAEMKSIVPLVPTVSPLLTNSKNSCMISNISVKSVSKLQQSDTTATSVRCVSNHVTGTAVLPKNFSCVKNIVPNTQIITAPSILPKTFSNATTANTPKNFTLSPGQYKCLQVLPVSAEKSKLSPYKNSPSLIIPIVTPGISNPVMVKNDGLSKGIVCASKSVPNITPVKSPTVQNCVNNLVIPISPNKNMLLANSINFNTPTNFKGLASNSKPALIMDKNTITTSNTVSMVSPIRPSVSVCPTNLACPVFAEKSRVDVSSGASVTPGKSTVSISAGTSITPKKSSVNVSDGTSITPGQSTLSVSSGTSITPGKSSLSNSAGTSITPEKSTLNVSSGTLITPGKSTLNNSASSSITPGKSTMNVSAGTSITPEKSTMACKVNNPVPALATINTNDASSTTSAKNNASTICHTPAPVATPGKPKVPSSSCSNTSQLLTPGKSKAGTPTITPGSSPKVKKRNVKKAKSSSPPPLKFEPFPVDTARLVSAPVYYPKADEFSDPLEYINKIRSEAEQYGICKIIPPASFKPECKVNDDMRFTAHNQYLHKMLHRWGPNVQHTACIRKHLKSQKVKLEQPPLIGGIELDVSKFYHTVQQFGGLQQVIEKKKWQKVADVMRVPKTAQDRVTKLYDAYCKYLVSYDTLPAEEKQKIEEEVKADHEKWVKLRNSTSESSEKEEDEMEDENNDCVTKGRSMSLSNFFRIARNTMSMWFKNEPPPEEVENEFWKLVTERQQHVVVHAGNIDSSVTQSGFPTNKSSFAKHPWNLKILTNNSRSILKSMGPLSGITIPTLHVGMLFTTGCWYRDPHSFPWIEYLHTGASKIWYGIPAKGCEKFRNAMRKIMPEVCTTKPLWLSSDTAMVPPDLLVKHGASLSRTIQSSGQFIVIFPESFTSTICCGYCVSESVYFAPTSWLDLAVKAFQDIQNSCESPAFSLERLLFSIANDPKPQLKIHLKILQKILPMIENIRFKELHLRAQLNELGLKQFERLPLIEVQGKKKKSRNAEEENEHECEVCRTPCYVSMVIYPQEDAVYCLPHALEHIQKKNLKLCKLKYTYSEHDLNELIKKITDLVSQLPSPSIKKKLSKKKVQSVDNK